MRSEQGVALIVALGILAIVAILGTSFVLATRMEHKMAQSYMGDARAEEIARSGFEHAMAVLRFDKLGTDDQLSTDLTDDITNYTDAITGNFIPVRDDSVDTLYDVWRQQFWDGDPQDMYEDLAGDSVGIEDDIDVFGFTDGSVTDPDDEVCRDNSTWITVHGTDKNGTVLGRYAVLVEDELGKINVNACSGDKDSGSPYEPIESDHPLFCTPWGIRLQSLFDLMGYGVSAEEILASRWGGSGSPGLQDVDDDMDGVLDEDDPDESIPFGFLKPFGQMLDATAGDKDIVYETLDQVRLGTSIPEDFWDGTPESPTSKKGLKHLLTSFSMEHDLSATVDQDPASELTDPLYRQRPKVYLNGTFLPDDDLCEVFAQAGLDDPGALAANIMAFVDEDCAAPLSVTMNRTQEYDASNNLYPRVEWGFRPLDWDTRRIQDIDDPEEREAIWNKYVATKPVWARDAEVCWLWDRYSDKEGSIENVDFFGKIFNEMRYYGIEGPRIAEVLQSGRIRLDVEHDDEPQVDGDWSTGGLKWYHEIVTAVNPSLTPVHKFNKGYYANDSAQSNLRLIWKNLPVGEYVVTLHAFQGACAAAMDVMVNGAPVGWATMPGGNDTWEFGTTVISDGTLTLDLRTSDAALGDYCSIDYVEIEVPDLDQKFPCQYVEIENLVGKRTRSYEDSPGDRDNFETMEGWYLCFGNPWVREDADAVPAWKIPNGSVVDQLNNPRVVVCPLEGNFDAAKFDDDTDSYDKDLRVADSANETLTSQVKYVEGGTTKQMQFKVRAPGSSGPNIDNALQRKPCDIYLADPKGRIVDRFGPPLGLVYDKKQSTEGGSFKFMGDSPSECTMVGIQVEMPLFPTDNLSDWSKQAAHAWAWLGKVDTFARRAWQSATLWVNLTPGGGPYRVWDVDITSGSGPGGVQTIWLWIAKEDGMPIDNYGEDYKYVGIQSIQDNGKPSLVELLLDRQAFERVDPGIDACPHNIQPVLFEYDGNPVGLSVAMENKHGGRPFMQNPVAESPSTIVGDRPAWDLRAYHNCDPTDATDDRDKPQGITSIAELQNVAVGYFNHANVTQWPTINDAQGREAVVGNVLRNLGTSGRIVPWFSMVADSFTTIGYKVDVEAAIAAWSDPDDIVKCEAVNSDNIIPEASGQPKLFHFENLRVRPGNYVVMLRVVPDDPDPATYTGAKTLGLALGVSGNVDRQHIMLGTKPWGYYSDDAADMPAKLLSRFYCFDGLYCRSDNMSPPPYHRKYDSAYDAFENGNWAQREWNVCIHEGKCSPVDASCPLLSECDTKDHHWYRKEPVFYVNEKGTLDIFIQADHNGTGGTFKLEKLILSPLWIPGQVNINTAPPEVLKAALQSIQDEWAALDVDTVVSKIIERRTDLTLPSFGRRYLRNGTDWTDEKVAIDFPLEWCPSIGTGELFDVLLESGVSEEDVWGIYSQLAERFTISSDVYKITVIGQAWKDVAVRQDRTLQILDPVNDKLLGEKRITSVVER